MGPQIQVHDLRAVVEVAERASFAQAAEALMVSRATMSELIKGVERQLGVRLFDRTTRRVRPTPAGEVFVAHATRLLVELGAMTDAVREAGEQPRGTVRLGLPGGVVNQQVWHIISTFHRDHPGIELEFTETSTDEVVRLIQKRELDLSIVAWPVGHLPANVATAVLRADPTGVAVASDHPLTTMRGTVPLEALDGIPLVTFTRGFALRTIAEDFCRRAGLEPAIALQSAVDETVAGLVRAHVGYTITTLRHAQQEQLTTLPMEVPCIERVVGLAWSPHGQLAPVAAKLRDRIVNGFHTG